jgi:outer membrane lipopolysaccharide assembly protein LptE/RlpB
MRTNMKIIALSLVATVLALNLSACGFRAHKRKKIEQELQQQPISCATAEGDLRVLKSEKAHVAEQIAMGVTSIIPIGLVVGFDTMT